MRDQEVLLNSDIGLVTRDRILVHETRAAQFYIGLGRRRELLQRLTKAVNMSKDGFDRNQPRDDNGRWTAGTFQASTSGGEGAPKDSSLMSQVIGTAAAIPQIVGDLPDFPSIFSSIASGTRKALGAIIDGLEGPVIAFTAWFIPLRDGASGTGDLPGDPDVHYHYDEDARTFTIWTADHEIQLDGTIDGHGIIRDEDGDVIGQHVNGGVSAGGGGGLVIDTTKLPIESEKEETAPVAGAVAQEIANTKSQDERCPDPLPDIPGYRSARSLAYQAYINVVVNPATPLPPTLAVYLRNPITGRPVSYDNCYEQTGTMVDAKGPGYARLLNRSEKTRFLLSLSLLMQARRQIDAAQGRQIIWYTDEPELAAHLRRLFYSPKAKEQGYDKIAVVNLPMPDEIRRFLVPDGDDLFAILDN